MKAYDLIAKKEVEVTRQQLVDLMLNNRQIDLKFDQTKTDGDGYLTWDAENWTAVDARRFLRCYALAGRVLRDSTSHNLYDLDNDFFPEQAAKVEIN